MKVRTAVLGAESDGPKHVRKALTRGGARRGDRRVRSGKGRPPRAAADLGCQRPTPIWTICSRPRSPNAWWWPSRRSTTPASVSPRSRPGPTPCGKTPVYGPGRGRGYRRGSQGGREALPCMGLNQAEARSTGP